MLTQPMLQKIQSTYDEIYHNELSLQLETLSNCDNFTVITVLHNNNDVLTWDNKNNNNIR